MSNENHTDMEQPCTDSKLLALHTAMVCLTRTLAGSGQLDRDAFKTQLTGGRQWLDAHDHSPGHNVQAFDDLLDMLLKI